MCHLLSRLGRGGGEAMSVPDKWLDEPDACSTHGEYLPCYLCRIDWDDEQADQQIQAEKEG